MARPERRAVPAAEWRRRASVRPVQACPASLMNVYGRMRVAKEAGYLFLSQDDGQEIYGRDDLPSTVEFDGNE